MRILPVLVTAAALLVSCGGQRQAALPAAKTTKTLTIKIEPSAPEILSGAGTELAVRVIEISGADQKKLVNQTLPVKPILEVAYDPAAVLEQHDYSLEVIVMRGGSRVAGSSGDYLVLSKGRGDRVTVKLAP